MKQKLLFVLLMVFFAGALVGQTRQLTGTVTSSADKQPLPGVTVLVKGSQTGTSPNIKKIALQKWISLFKQSVEAWSESRRTDVPLMMGVSENYALKHNRPPFRMAYADEEKSLNTSFPKEVVESDIFWGTQVWWDTRTGIQ